MTATARTPDWRRSAPRFKCGDPRTAENTYRGQCRTCRRRANARKAKRDYTRRAHPLCSRHLRIMAIDRPQKPAIGLTTRTLELIEACRAEYLAATGQLELFAPLPYSDD